MRKLHFFSQQPANSAVIDSATGNVLYEFFTTDATTDTASNQHGGERVKVTTMWNAQRQVVALYTHGASSKEEVTYSGQTRSVDDWLLWSSKPAPTESTSTSRECQFALPDGKKYKWTYHEDGTRNRRFSMFPSDQTTTYELFECETGQFLANGHRPQRGGLFACTKKLKLDVMADGEAMLDAIVLTFVLCVCKPL
ncbi:hypothetical protein ONZ51_g7759 [Trametes cubensis]|uniref:DUF6593 domain-containing protein n=1 Tax=Trametes cubensis TaxID=1111947 RepID=A0AAD7XBE9_9APHY|nr:hypothetical protein ONZ51_g7759 [Trametes cubensis]